MALSQMEEILILAKTYPSPSARYVETSCIAGINREGAMRRLYPVPFRMVEKTQQFKKWQWITVRVEKSSSDHRPESYKVYIDTIVCKDVIEPRKWAIRQEWLHKIPTFDNFEGVESACLHSELSLAVLRPKSLLGLEITKAKKPDWTEGEKEKLMRAQMQGNLFSEAEVKQQVRLLRKIPYDFKYRYICDMPEGEKEHEHKIVDWEAGALFWNCYQKYGDGWENPFRAKLEEHLGNMNLMFLMGDQHRFQNQWLIVSLIYPPKQKPFEATQGLLL